MAETEQNGSKLANPKPLTRRTDRTNSLSGLSELPANECVLCAKLITDPSIAVHCKVSTCRGAAHILCILPDCASARASIQLARIALAFNQSKFACFSCPLCPKKMAEQTARLRISSERAASDMEVDDADREGGGPTPHHSESDTTPKSIPACNKLEIFADRIAAQITDDTLAIGITDSHCVQIQPRMLAPMTNVKLFTLGGLKFTDIPNVISRLMYVKPDGLRRLTDLGLHVSTNDILGKTPPAAIRQACASIAVLLKDGAPKIDLKLILPPTTPAVTVEAIATFYDSIDSATVPTYPGYTPKPGEVSKKGIHLRVEANPNLAEHIYKCFTRQVANYSRPPVEKSAKPEQSAATSAASKSPSSTGTASQRGTQRGPARKAARRGARGHRQSGPYARRDRPEYQDDYFYGQQQGPPSHQQRGPGAYGPMAMPPNPYGYGLPPMQPYHHPFQTMPPAALFASPPGGFDFRGAVKEAVKECIRENEKH